LGIRKKGRDHLENIGVAQWKVKKLVFKESNFITVTGHITLRE
jgi:hypothetical protein